jgi:ABC-type transport system involved in multi-copper enzyme maturation permease subunit
VGVATVRATVESFNEIGAIWRGEVGRALKSGRVLVLLLLFLLFVGLALTVVGFFNHQINAQVDQAIAMGQGSAEAAQAQMLQQKKQFLSFVITDDEAMLEALTPLPLVLLVVFKLTLRFLPLLIALMGFDQLAAEVGPRSIRYLVVRVRRHSIVVGKFLAQATLFALLLAVATVMMVAVAKALNDDFAASQALLWTAKLYASSLAMALAYLALTTLCSSLVRSPPVALVLNIILLFVIWFVALVGEAFRFPGEVAAPNTLAMLKAESLWAWLRYASVWHFGQDLLHPYWQRFLTAGLMHVGFGLAFLGAAQLVMQRRDL